VSSSLTWLAYSEAERKRTLDVIRLLDEPGTLDEIGIGGIRDAFAELLFPGTSTIQTRARYFLFVPWIYRGLERRAPVESAAAKARRDEVRLIMALLDAGDTRGVIGKEARERLQRLPSVIYWQGLQRWGIRIARVSLRGYHRALERAAVTVWHGELPEAPPDFPRQADLALTLTEAEFLRDMITTHCPDTLLSVLALHADEGPVRADAPWQIDEAILAGAGPAVREQLDHARVFSELIFGAQLLYNLMLAEKRHDEQLIEEYERLFGSWAAAAVPRRRDLGAWDADRRRFWEIVRLGNPRLRPRAHAFAEEWFDLVLEGDPAALAADPRARTLIGDRERALKGRLARIDNASALDAWNGSSGSDPLLFRWPRAEMLLDDLAVAFGSADPRGAR
jgi:uncharacterized protein DUF6361